MFRTFLASIFVVSGIVLFIMGVFDGRWLFSITILVSGVVAGYSALIGITESLENIFVKLGGSLMLVLGFFAVIVNHDAFSSSLNEAHIAALNQFVTLESKCQPMNAQLRSLKNEGVIACALENNRNMVEAILELNKAQQLGPTLSMIDSIRSAVVEDGKNWCAETYKETASICKDAFVFMSAEHRRTLEEKLR